MSSLLIDVENVVTKSNKLIEARGQNLTEIEQKIIATLISNVQPTDKEFRSYTFSIKDFTEMIGGNSNTRHREMETITRNLLSKVTELRLEDKLTQAQWISQADYNYKQGTIELTLHNFLQPYLLELKKEFTTYRLKNISKMKGHYSIPLYELMKKWEIAKKKSYTIEELRAFLGVPADKYPAYGNFKQRVLLPAQKQINKLSDIEIDFKEIKRGRSVDKIQFFISSKPGMGTLPRPISEKVIENNAAEQNEESSVDIFSIAEEEDVKELQTLALESNFHLSKETAKNWLLFDKEKVINEIKAVKYNEKIHNPIGFITSELRKEKQPAEDVIEIDPIQKAIRQIIIEHLPEPGMRNGLITTAFIYPKVIKRFEEVAGEKEAFSLWEKHSEEILNEINKFR